VKKNSNPTRKIGRTAGREKGKMYGLKQNTMIRMKIEKKKKKKKKGKTNQTKTKKTKKKKKKRK